MQTFLWDYDPPMSHFSSTVTDPSGREAGVCALTEEASHVVPTVVGQQYTRLVTQILIDYVHCNKGVPFGIPFP